MNNVTTEVYGFRLLRVRKVSILAGVMGWK